MGVVPVSQLAQYNAGVTGPLSGERVIKSSSDRCETLPGVGGKGFAWEFP